MRRLTGLDWTALILVIIGGLNWGLVALNPRYDLVAGIAGGQDAILAKIIYGLVGLSALYLVFVVSQYARR